MSDLIDRQAALDALIFDVRADRQNRKTLMVRYAEEVLKRIKALPSAQPERKGKWVGYDGDLLKTMCKCSKCGAMIDINEKYRNFFCYHCGARMDGEQDG